MNISNAYIGDVNISQFAPYLYFISYVNSLGSGFLYIGETCEKFGALGRLARHLSYEDSQNRKGATFLTNMQKKCGIDDLRAINNLYFIAVDLREYGTFDGEASKTKRMGLEFLIRAEMQAFSSDDKVIIPYEIVSTARRTRYSDKPECEKIAEEIVMEITKRIVFVTGELRYM